MNRRIRRTTLLTVGCVAFLSGLGIARFGVTIPNVYLIVFAIFSIITFKKQSFATVLIISILGVCLGIARGQNFLPNTKAYSELHQQKVELVGVAETDATYDERKQLSFDLTNIQVNYPIDQELVGKVKIAGFGENVVYKGDTVGVTGKLFVTRGSRQASINFATLQLIESNSLMIDNVRRKFAAGLSSMLPDPQAPLGLGLLIGQRSTLGKEATGWLSAVGLTHIIAVSGYNLTIIIRFVHRLFAKRSRYQTLLASSLLITAFLLVTGFSASIIRAALVSGIGLVAWYFGRKVKPVLLIALAAAITAGWYPIYIWSDIGWYLSFLAFFGVLVLAPLVARRFWKHNPKVIGSAVIESMCAQIMTLPLILYIFGETSLVALVANALVVPLVPIAMLLTLFAGLAGMFMPTILLIALPANLILTYIIDIARLLSKIAGARVNVDVSLATTIIFYGLLIMFCMVLWQKTKSKHGIITDVNMI